MGKELKDNDQMIKYTGIKAESKVTLILDIRGGPMNSSSVSRFPSASSFTKFYSTAVRFEPEESSEEEDGTAARPSRFIHETFDNFDSEDSEGSGDDQGEHETTKENEDDKDEQSKIKSKSIDPAFRAKAERWRDTGDFSEEDSQDSEYEKLSNSEVYLHSYQNGNAVLVVFEKRRSPETEYNTSRNQEGPYTTNDPKGISFGKKIATDKIGEKGKKNEDRDALIKSATSLIDDTRLNIKMRNLKKKMQESKLKSQARSGKNGEGTVKLPELPRVLGPKKVVPPVIGRFRFEKNFFEKKKFRKKNFRKNLPPIKPKEKPIVKNNHEQFCQKYNLTSPRSDEDHVISRLDSAKRLSPKHVLPPIDLRKAGYKPLDAHSSYVPPNSKYQKQEQIGEVTGPNHKLPLPPKAPNPKKLTSGNKTKPKNKKQKCQVCKKKINLGMEFTCRCGKLVCGQHRLPETHECSFDYKMFGKEVLKKENPVVAADKLSKFE